MIPGRRKESPMKWKWRISILSTICNWWHNCHDLFPIFGCSYVSSIVFHMLNPFIYIFIVSTVQGRNRASAAVNFGTDMVILAYLLFNSIRTYLWNIDKQEQNSYRCDITCSTQLNSLYSLSSLSWHILTHDKWYLKTLSPLCLNPLALNI